MQQLIDGPPTLNASDILFDPKKDRLGNGSYGSAYKGIVMGLPVAIKVPNKQHSPNCSLLYHRCNLERCTAKKCLPSRTSPAFSEFPYSS